jgi:hypothetical protein
MTLAQTRNFVLTRLSLQRLKMSERNYLAGVNYVDKHYRRSRRLDRRPGTWRYGILDPEYWASITIVEPVPTPLTYYDVDGNRRIMP